MARFCLATKVPPSEYRRMSLRERAAFVRALGEMHGVDNGEEVEVEWDGD